MKTAIVPAQITTVEDKVVGNLSMQQMVLAVFPLFVGAGLFTLAPSMFVISTYKLIILGIVAIICLTSAVRIKGTLIIYIVIRLLHFHTRPRLYVYRRSDDYLREKLSVPNGRKQVAIDVPQTMRKETRGMQPDAVRTLKLASAVSDNAHFTIKQGGLHVRFTSEK